MSRASDGAYQQIRQKILSGELGPDRQLTERELADFCGVSRTPVRDALRRLETELLVQRSDTQRWHIRKWNVDHVEEIFTLRCLLESHAAKRAASRITDNEIAELEQINAAILDSIDNGTEPDVQTFLACNSDFHRVILEASRSERLIAMRSVLFEPSSSALTSRKYTPAHLRRSHADHDELIFAFRLRDADWARLVMDNHIHHAFMMAVRHAGTHAPDTIEGPAASDV